MWRIQKIKATNICSFSDLEYTPETGKTTLVFGKNLDNDSQGSNGSGKSALIEAVAIGLTGDILRKVNFDDAINDSSQEAEVELVLTNDSSDDVFVISRLISRTSPQSVTITLNDKKISEPSVNEYNKRIFEILGVDKEDIFSTFVLSKHRYAPFLTASDRTKKELINRFSNGYMVDKSLELLNADTDKQKGIVVEKEKEVALSSGKISATEEQIETLNREQLEKSTRRLEIIEAHKESIAKYQRKIRECHEKISECNDRIDEIGEADKELQEIEPVHSSLKEALENVNFILRKYHLPAVKDYSEIESRNASKIVICQNNIACINDDLLQCTNDIAQIKSRCVDLKEELEDATHDSEPIFKQIDEEIKLANEKVHDIDSRQRILRREYDNINQKVSEINNLLAGAIVCPNCNHQFILESNKSVDELEKEKKSHSRSIDKLKEEGEDNKARKEVLLTDIESCENTVKDLNNRLSQLNQDLKKQNLLLSEAERKQSDIRLELGQEKGRLTMIQESLNKARTNMFDAAYDTIDSEIKNKEREIKSLEIDCETHRGNIESYKEAIKQAENISADTAIDSLKEKLEIYREGYDVNMAYLEVEKKKLDKLVCQQARFVDFKTHLANSKITALSQMTNKFLESIGSDLRIAMSGYTPLKNGKVREKISIAVIRDGVDCGAFAKLSQGEQCRVNLASILAIHKLTNMDCTDNKGLDLLILDEILDATDEAGLSHMFNALNSLQITSMIVTHGQTAENYPHKLLVVKRNGISTLQ